MKNCIKCGKELNDDAEFCTECGSVQVEKAPQEEASATAEPSAAEKSEPIPPAPKKQPLIDKFSHLVPLSVISGIAGICFWIFGFYKYLSYNSGEEYPYEASNAYVGGDAYNFIINGTYFTAFAVIGGVLILGAFILFACHTLIKAMGERE